MKINLISMDIEMESLDINIRKWFNMNKKFILNMVRSYIRNYGWAFGGASEMYLNLEQLYKEHPYNLEDKYGESKPYYILAAA